MHLIFICRGESILAVVGNHLKQHTATTSSQRDFCNGNDDEEPEYEDSNENARTSGKNNGGADANVGNDFRDTEGRLLPFFEDDIDEEDQEQQENGTNGKSNGKVQHTNMGRNNNECQRSGKSAPAPSTKHQTHYSGRGIGGREISLKQRSSNETPSTMTRSSEGIHDPFTGGSIIANASSIVTSAGTAMGNLKFASGVLKQQLTLVRGFVKGTLFRKVKFIITDKQMEWDFESFAKPIMDYMGMPGEDPNREAVWGQWKKHAKKALDERRNTVNLAVKESVQGKCLGKVKK